MAMAFWWSLMVVVIVVIKRWSSITKLTNQIKPIDRPKKNMAFNNDTCFFCVACWIYLYGFQWWSSSAKNWWADCQGGRSHCDTCCCVVYDFFGHLIVWPWSVMKMMIIWNPIFFMIYVCVSNLFVCLFDILSWILFRFSSIMIITVMLMSFIFIFWFFTLYWPLEK